MDKSIHQALSPAHNLVVAVTGGSRGIGKAICLAFAQAGAQVFFSYVSNDEAARAVETEIKATGQSAQAICADVTDETQVKDFFDRILETSGRIDVLVNNAGITRDGLLARMKTADWQAVMETNLQGVFLCTRQVTKPMMKQRAGRIINLTSVVGVSGNAGQANYAASKAGIIGFTKAVAKELASRNITANAVAPGYVATDMTAAVSEKARKQLEAQIPLGRVGTPQDVAAAVCFLASPGAAYITGQTLHVSGGMYM
ncbi:MAG: 3-oxoacyl-[acyl-carrier-protein] reductase [Desulfobacterales bacterium]